MTLDLSAFEGLQHGWDGYDGIAPSPDAVENFRWLVQELTWPEFDIYPDSSGRMNIESDTLTGVTFHLTVSATHYTMYVKIGGSDTATYYCQGKFSEGNFPFSEVQTALDSLIKLQS